MEIHAEMTLKSLSKLDDQGDENVTNLHIKRRKEAILHVSHVHFSM